MGMKSGKTLKPAKAKASAKRPKRAAKPAPKPKRAKAAAPRPAAPTVRVETRVVEVDRNKAIRALAQRIVDVTIANDDEGMFALYSPDIESVEADNPPMVGVDALRQKFASWRQMVSDAAFVPRSIAADGDTIVIEWQGKVTLAASGRMAEMNEVAVHQIRNGKIVKERFYYDPSKLQP